MRLDGRRQAAAAEGDRVDGDDPPRRRSGRAAVRPQARRCSRRPGSTRATRSSRCSAIADEDRDQRPGRRYLGVCAPGRRFKQVLIRVYVAQLQAAWTVLGRQPGAGGRRVHDAGRLLQLAARARRDAPPGRGRRPEPHVRRRRRGARPPDPRGADLAQVGLRHPAGARPARRLPRVAGGPPAAQGRRDVVDRRAAGDEHDLGRRRRPATRRDGRRRPAEVDQRVHPGDQPRRAPASRARARGLQLGPAP